jgi:hypothetical protein
MTEEVLLIQMIVGMSCPDGRRFMELRCTDTSGNAVNIVLPATTLCGEETGNCDSCSKNNDCEMQDALGIDLGRKLIIKR